MNLDDAKRVLGRDQSDLAGQEVMPAGNPKLPEVIQRYRNGESVQDIAKDCRVNAKTIYRWMLAGLGDKAYFNLVTECLVDRIADADMAMERATTLIDVAKAKSAQRFTRLDFERRRPNLYGQQQESPDNKVIVVVNRQGSSAQVLPYHAREQADDSTIVEPIVDPDQGK